MGVAVTRLGVGMRVRGVYNHGVKRAYTATVDEIDSPTRAFILRDDRSPKTQWVVYKRTDGVWGAGLDYGVLEELHPPTFPWEP